MYFNANFTGNGGELYKITDPFASVTEQPAEVNFKVYPNPTRNQLTITTAGNSTFSLLNLTGKVLKSFEVQQEKEISTVDLAPGIYIVRENTSGAQTKIVKQ